MSPAAVVAYKPLFRHAFPVVLMLAVVFAGMRVVGMIGPPSWRMALPLGFVCMMLLPFVLLDKDGRRRVGFARSAAGYYGRALLWGALAAIVCFLAGWLLFGTSADNWFITVRNAYANTFPTAGMPVHTLFVTFTLPALLFSPLGEEIFFRGVLQEALHERYTIRTAVIIEAAIFGVVHIVHHGLVRTAVGIAFFPVSGVLWVLLMFGTAYGFAWLRERSGSLYPAMVAHACFNLTMNLFVFLVLWN